MGFFSIFRSLFGFWFRILGASFSAVGILSLSQRYDALSLPNLTSLLVDRYKLLRTDLFDLVAGVISVNLSADTQDAILIICVLGGLVTSSFFTAVRKDYAGSVVQAILVVIGGALLFHYLVGPFLKWGLSAFAEYTDKFFVRPYEMLRDKAHYFSEVLGAGSTVLTNTYLYVIIVSSVLLLFPITVFLGFFVIVYAYHIGNPQVLEKFTPDSKEFHALNQKFNDVLRFTASLWLHTLAFTIALVLLLGLPI